jgi:hypothetical protein
MNYGMIDLQRVEMTKEKIQRVMNEYFTCYVTVKNLSSYNLYNGMYEADWGKYTVQPLTNLQAGREHTFIMTGRQWSSSGCEGALTYQVGEQGMGNIKLYFACPFSDDNKGVPTCNAMDVKLSVFGNIAANHSWGYNPAEWGEEGQVPTDGHPLSLLFVVENISAK